jgi:hypothetical protein
MPSHSNTKCKTIQTKLASLLERHFSHLLAFLFFRSFRATLISLIIVIGACGPWILGLLNYEITVLTALVPSLIIVIEFQIVFS